MELLQMKDQDYLSQLRRRISEVSFRHKEIQNNFQEFELIKPDKQILLSSTSENLSATSHHGHRSYLNYLSKTKKYSLNNHVKSFNLFLTKPYKELYLEADYIEKTKQCQEDLNKKSHLEGNLHDDHQKAKTSTDIRLWTDKYKAQSYIELLSDETINRTILSWFKSWDKSVFGDKHEGVKRKLKTETNVSFSKIKDKSGFNSHFRTHSFPTADDFIFELGEDNKPCQKIAIIWGPPGLGKTTLAHTIANHCGYNAVEINASEDRNVDSFVNVIENVIQTHSIHLGIDPKPKCLILDEIDGASTAAIQVLVKLLESNSRANAKETMNSEAEKIDRNPKTFKTDGKTRSKKKVATLNRPIICLANDIYVAALRPLRQMALVVHLDSVPSQRLVTRLKQITSLEGLSFETDKVVNALCENMENDVRSCINGLQFIRSKVISKSTEESNQQQNVITREDLKGLVSEEGFEGKDKTFDLKKLLQTVFTKPNPDQHSSKHQNALTANTQSVRQVLALAGKLDDYERGAQSLFENYLNVPYKDTLYLHQTIGGLDWFSTFYDPMVKHMLTTQNYSFYKYSQYLYAIFHLKMATNFHFGNGSRLFTALGQGSKGGPKSLKEAIIAHSRKNYEIHLATNQITYIAKTMLRNVTPKIKPFVTFDLVITELTPYLVEIIKPTLRQVNYQIFSEVEKKIISSVIAVMLDYDLTYKQERRQKTPANNNQTSESFYEYYYVLEPNIEELAYFKTQSILETTAKPIDFSGPKQQSVLIPDRPELSYAIKQIIHQQLILAKLKRVEDRLPKSSDSSRVQTAAVMNEYLAKKSPFQSSSKSYNKFGNAVKSKCGAEKLAHTSDPDTKTCPRHPMEVNRETNEMGLPKGVHYLYKNGHTNAVRRFVKIRQFLDWA